MEGTTDGEGSKGQILEYGYNPLTCGVRQIFPQRPSKALWTEWLCYNGSKGQVDGPGIINIIFPESFSLPTG